MKNYLYSIIAILCLYLCTPAWGQTVQPGNTLKVQITGLPKKPLQNVLKTLIKKQKLIKDRFTVATLMRFYRSIPKEIKKTIAPYGYFKPRIHAYIQRDRYFWSSHFVVSPGPRMKFTTLDLHITGPGSQDPIFKRLYEKFPVNVGDNFNSTKYENAKNKLFAVASAHGYFKAKMIKSAIYVNLSTYEAHVVIHFETGPRYHFGKTTFSHTPFNIHFLHRFLRYKKGELYRQRKVRHTRTDLANSNYFQQVIVTPKPQKAKKLEVPMNITISPQLKKQYTFGLGYGTDTGIRGLAGINYRWVNQWGHRFNAYVRGSKKNSDAIASYYIPGHNPVTDQYIFTGGYLNQNQITGKGNSLRFSFIYQTELLGWQHSISLTYLKERYNLIDLPFTNTSLVYPTYTLQRVWSNNPLHPKFGYSIVGHIMGASKNVLSETSFVQTRIDSKFLFTLFKTTRFLIRGTIGHTDINNLVKLPLSLQFFAGGAQSLRGFGYNTIGPGRYIFVGSFEIQQKIKGNFYLAAFIDFGNVTDNLTEHKLKEGIGPAIAWISPIGTFELSVANAISQPNKPWVIQFSMGPAI